MQQQEKITQKHFNDLVKVQSSYNYENALLWLEKWGKKLYGKQFKIYEKDKSVIYPLICYFLKDEVVAAQLQINLNKGILLTGPIGCGKTSLMTLMRLFEPADSRFIMKSCRDVSFEFIKDGYDVIYRYTQKSFHPNTHLPKHYCFDDLGTENNLKYFGNECNVMAEVILSRYDFFVPRKLMTHLTSNLSASEIEDTYGNRVRSRMREMFNLMAFNKESIDKRK